MTRVQTTVPAGAGHERPVPLPRDPGQQPRGFTSSDAGVSLGEGLRFA